MQRVGARQKLALLFCWVAVVGTMSFGAGHLASAASALPAGFTDEQWVSGLYRPYQMEFAPDGRLFVSQQGGALRVIKNGVLQTNPFVTLNVDTRGDRGLIGIAFDPQFASNHFVYVYYTATTPAPHNRVSRFTANGDVAVPGSERVLLELPNLGTEVVHNGGSIHFGADGKLYVAVGDNAQSATAQSMTSLFGKMLRINRDGSIPTDNPFYLTSTGAHRAIWALGLRNPFTFGVQPGTGRILINDVGAQTWEEIDDGAAGANYGWPVTEGPTTDPRFVSPLFAYTHGSTNTTGCAIVGGAFYNPALPTFPSSYVGRYFFGDACNGWIRVLDPATATAQQFLTQAVGIVDIKIGHDGALYYLSRTQGTNNPGFVHRVQYSGAPVIASQPSDQTAAPGESASFSVIANGQQPLTYQWRRDGSNIAGATAASYTLQSVSLGDDGAQFDVVVRNSWGTATSHTATLTVTTNSAPTATIVTPSAGTRYDAGDTIVFSGVATDAEDGVVPGTSFVWSVDFHHNTHTHPGPGVAVDAGGASGTFSIPDVGETSADVLYRLYLAVTDSGGRTSETFVDIVPNTTTLTFTTTPTTPDDGLQITLDSQPHPTPYAEQSVVGMRRLLGAPSPQTLGTTTYVFTAWSDGGAQSHEIVTPAAAVTYTATYSVGSADTTPPSVAVTSPAPASTVSATVTLAAEASDNVGVTVVKWFIDGVQVAQDSDGAPWSKLWDSRTVSDGTHRIVARARDAAGNWGSSSSVTFGVNNGAAVETTITSGPTMTNDTTPTFSFTSNISGSTFACRTDGGSFAACSSPLTLPPMSQGSHTFEVRATAPNGSTDPTPASRTFTVDTTPPTVSMTSPANNATVTGTVTLGANAADLSGVSTVKFYVDNVLVASDSDGAPWTRTWNSATVGNGSHKILAKARDAAGNWASSKAITVTVANG